jgi:hypothetical protein
MKEGVPEQNQSDMSEDLENLESHIKREKLSVDSAKYLSSRKEKKAEQEKSTEGTAFGDNTLHYIDVARDLHRYNPEAASEQVHEFLEHSRKSLMESLDSATLDSPGPYSTFSLVRSLVREALQDEVFRRTWIQSIAHEEASLSHPHDEFYDQLRLMDALQDGVLPDELHERLLRIHTENFKKKQAEFEKKLPRLLKSVRANLLTGIQKKQLPITKELIETRLSETTIRLQDALRAHLKELWGEYIPHTGNIYIAENVPDNYIKETLTHEVFHALSGRTAFLERYMDEENENEPAFDGTFDSVAHQRTGAGFYEDPFGSIERLGWLDEAITERLTMQLTKASTGSYPQERLLLDLLLSRGKHPVDPHFFVDAYFENYEPSNPEKVPAWKTMVFVITKSYRPGFLVEIDKIVQERGVGAAIKFMKANNFSR